MKFHLFLVGIAGFALSGEAHTCEGESKDRFRHDDQHTPRYLPNQNSNHHTGHTQANYWVGDSYNQQPPTTAWKFADGKSPHQMQVMRFKTSGLQRQQPRIPISIDQSSQHYIKHTDYSQSRRLHTDRSTRMVSPNCKSSNIYKEKTASIKDAYSPSTYGTRRMTTKETPWQSNRSDNTQKKLGTYQSQSCTHSNARDRVDSKKGSFQKFLQNLRQQRSITATKCDKTQRVPQNISVAPTTMNVNTATTSRSVVAPIVSITSTTAKVDTSKNTNNATSTASLTASSTVPSTTLSTTPSTASSANTTSSTDTTSSTASSTTPSKALLTGPSTDTVLSTVPSTVPSTTPSTASSTNITSSTASSTTPSIAPSTDTASSTVPSIVPSTTLSTVPSTAPSTNITSSTTSSIAPSTAPSTGTVSSTVPPTTPLTASSANTTTSIAPSIAPSTNTVSSTSTTSSTDNTTTSSTNPTSADQISANNVTLPAEGSTCINGSATVNTLATNATSVSPSNQTQDLQTITNDADNSVDSDTSQQDSGSDPENTDSSDQTASAANITTIDNNNNPDSDGACTDGSVNGSSGTEQVTDTSVSQTTDGLPSTSTTDPQASS